jgi:replicative DNA helicase
VDALPPFAAEFVQDVATELQVPVALPGCCALGVISASVGHLEINTWAGRALGANLYIMAGARSGAGKSQTFAPVCAPLLEIEAEVRAHWESQRRPHALGNQLLFRQEQQDLKKSLREISDPKEKGEIAGRLIELQSKFDALESELKKPTLLCEDITPQKLEELLLRNGEKIFSASPDAGSALSHLLHNRSNVTIYVKAFSRDYARTDRIVRNQVALTRPTLTILWLMQPDRLERLFRSENLADSGFLPRLLACQVNTELSKIDSSAPAVSVDATAKWSQFVRSVFNAYHRQPSPAPLRPSKETLAVLEQHQHRTIDQAKDMPDMESYIVRWSELAFKLTAVLHVAEHGAKANQKSVQPKTAKAAVQLMDWFAQHQLQLLSQRRATARRNREDAVFELLQRPPMTKENRIVPAGSITGRDLQLAHVCRSAAEAHLLLQQMEADGKLVGHGHKPPHGGHEVRCYHRAGT